MNRKKNRNLEFFDSWFDSFPFFSDSIHLRFISIPQKRDSIRFTIHRNGIQIRIRFKKQRFVPISGHGSIVDSRSMTLMVRWDSIAHQFHISLSHYFSLFTRETAKLPFLAFITFFFKVFFWAFGIGLNLSLSQSVESWAGFWLKSRSRKIHWLAFDFSGNHQINGLSLNLSQ